MWCLQYIASYIQLAIAMVALGSNYNILGTCVVGNDLFK